MTPEPHLGPPHEYPEPSPEEKAKLVQTMKELFHVKNEKATVDGLMGMYDASLRAETDDMVSDEWRERVLPEMREEFRAYAERLAAQSNQWRAAIDRALVDSVIDCTSDAESAQDAVKRLIKWTRIMALDPAISAEAQELIARGAQPAAPVTESRKLIGWRRADYTDETDDQQVARNWTTYFDVLPIFEGDPNTKLEGGAL